jgi:hypothetical protein
MPLSLLSAAVFSRCFCATVSSPISWPTPRWSDSFERVLHIVSVPASTDAT